MRDKYKKKNGKSLNDVGKENSEKIYGPTYENGHWRIKINLEMYSNYKSPDILTVIKVCMLEWPMQMVCRLHWFGHVQRMEENRIPKKVLYMNLEATGLIGRPRHRWQDEVREGGRLVDGKG
jgi:hypothetical protein